MSVQRTPDRRGNDGQIHWEEDLKPFSRLPRASARRAPAQAVPAWIPALVSLAAIALACAVAGSFFNNARQSLGAIVIVPTPTPTAPAATPTTRAVPATATPYVAPTDTPSPATPTPEAGAIRVGGFVRIIDTGPNGLNFRREASRNAEILRKLPENNVYEVTGGPTSADGLVWWRLKDADGTLGWGAATYLRAVPKP